MAKSIVNTLKSIRWGHWLMAIFCACMGAWASYVTLQYFKHGALALESDKNLQELATFAALMFVASEMGAFLIAALMPERELRARRWALTAFAFCVLGLEVCTIVAVQLALTTGADNHQLDVRQAEIDIRSRIAAIESDMAIARDTGAQQSLAARAVKGAANRAWALQQSAKTIGKASEGNAELRLLNEQLQSLVKQKRPTLVGVLGKDNALYYAVARGILISLGGLVFVGAAGALIRTARGGVAVVKPEPQTAAPAAPAPVPSFARDGVAPKNTSTDWKPWARNAAVAGGLAGLAGMANAVPTIAPTPPNSPEQVENSPEQVNLAPEQVRKARNQVRDGRKYELMVEDIRGCVSRGMKPTQGAIKAHLNCGWDVAKRIQKDLKG